MAETKKADVAVVDKSNWEWVEVPEKDLMRYNHPPIRINYDEYASGKHFVDPARAAQIRSMLKVYDNSILRIFQPDRDTQAEGIVRRMGAPLPDVVSAGE